MNNTDSIRTIKIEISELLSDEQKHDIDITIEDAFKVSELFTKLGIEHKSTSYITMHKYGYDVAKQMCPNLNTALLQQIAKVSLFNIKSWNARHKKSKWGYVGSKHKESYPLNKLSLTRRGEQTTFSTSNKRVKIIHDIPHWFDEKYPNKTLQSGSIIRTNDRYFICYSFKVSVKDCVGDKIIGIDRGLYNFVATSDGTLFSTKHLHAVERRYAHTKATLQSKGTRSAKKRLKKISGKEKRFRQDFDHCVSKQLANRDDVKCYVLEDLNGLRSTNRGKKMNKWLHKWSTFRFRTFLEYKCAMNGIEVQYVNPKYTSQRCSMCGNIDKDARNRNKYRCACCGHTEHADINASKNIRDRYLLSLVGKSGSIQPTVCSDDISLRTIPQPRAGGR